MALLAPASGVLESTYRSSETIVVRAVATVTTSYVGADHIRTAGAQWVSLDFALVWAAATSVDYRWDWSPDGTTWYPDTASSVSSGVATLLASSTTIAVTATRNWNDGPIRVRDNYMRIQVKAPAATSDTVGITATLLIDKNRNPS